jgi:hypothetical protein
MCVGRRTSKTVRHLLIFLSTVTSGALYAHDPITTQVTWNREMIRLLTARCVSCHHDGGAAFSLATYDDARPWAKAIKEETLERRMPPFAAVKGFADLRDDESLTMEQLELISDWVEGGAPEGDPTWLPTAGVSITDGKRQDDTLADRPDAGVRIDVGAGALLKHALTVTGVEVKSLETGGSLRAFAQLPDGKVEPLIWIYHYDPKFQRPYYFREPLMLPAGAKILMGGDHCLFWEQAQVMGGEMRLDGRVPPILWRRDRQPLRFRARAE